MKETAVTATGVIDTLLLLLIGIGPKLALVPYMQLTAPLEYEERTLVRRKMIVAATAAALVLVLLGEVLRRLLHFTVGSLSVAGGAILFVGAVRMVFRDPSGRDEWDSRDPDPLSLALVPLAVPYLLNPVGIVGLITISAEAGTFAVLAVDIAILAFVLALDAVVFAAVDRGAIRLTEDRLLLVEKIFGFLLAAIAVQLVFDGLHSSGLIGETH